MCSQCQKLKPELGVVSFARSSKRIHTTGGRSETDSPSPVVQQTGTGEGFFPRKSFGFSASYDRDSRNFRIRDDGPIAIPPEQSETAITSAQVFIAPPEISIVHGDVPIV